jgi:hypothetical protein
VISSAASSYRNANALRSSNSEILSGIVSKLDRTEQTQAGIMKKMETVDSATTIRLSDSREHVDKKFERNERSMDVAFDEVWEKVGLNNLEMKQSEGYIEWARSKKDSPKRRCGSRYWAKEEKERGIRYMEFYV